MDFELLELLRSVEYFIAPEEIVVPGSKSNQERQFKFSCMLDDLQLNFQVTFRSSFPFSIPKYYLLNEGIVRMPHIDADGYVCYSEEDSIVLNYKNPTGIIRETFASVKSIVSDGINRLNTVDFYNEFEIYWFKLRTQVFYSTLDLSVTEVSKIKISDFKKTKIVSTSESGIYDILRKIFVTESNDVTISNALYIPLELLTDCIPPIKIEELTVEYIRQLIYNNISDTNAKKLNELLEYKLQRCEYFFIRFRLPKGDYGSIGFKLDIKSCTTHPLLSDQSTKVHAIEVTKINKEYILNRGSSSLEWQNKKGLLIGCGSVGGFLAIELVKAGVLNLTLLDDDKLKLENIYRHALGNMHVDQNKAEALSKYLKYNFPYSNTTVIKNKIQHEIDKLFTHVFDFIVVATGNPAINLMLNNKLIQSDCSIPIFYAWNDPYGIGGHVLVSNIQKKGCYECLYTNEELCNVASFASNEQPRPFLKNLSGCGGAFVPFSSLDSNQTATLAVRAILNVLKGKLNKNSILSWKGDSEVFLNEGFNLAPRYYQTHDELEFKKTLFHNPECKVCNHEMEIK